MSGLEKLSKLRTVRLDLGEQVGLHGLYQASQSSSSAALVATVAGGTFVAASLAFPTGFAPSFDRPATRFCDDALPGLGGGVLPGDKVVPDRGGGVAGDVGVSGAPISAPCRRLRCSASSASARCRRSSSSTSSAPISHPTPAVKVLESPALKPKPEPPAAGGRADGLEALAREGDACVGEWPRTSATPWKADANREPADLGGGAGASLTAGAAGGGERAGVAAAELAREDALAGDRGLARDGEGEPRRLVLPAPPRKAAARRKVCEAAAAVSWAR